MMDHPPEDLPKLDHHHQSRQCKMTGRFFFILAIILAAIMSGPSLVVPKPSAAASVLLLNSYHKGLAWTDKVTLGVETVLSDQDIYVEYMDTKRHSDDLYLTLLRNLFYNKYQATRPDVVISSDDHALSFLLDNRDFLFPGTPIVFCGVNDYSDQLLAGQEKITGVVEAFDIRQTVDMALGLHPSADKMIIVNDTTKTGKANKRVILRLLPDFSGRVEFEFLEALSMPALLDRIEKLPSQNLVLLMSFNRDASGQVFNYDTSIGLIAEKCRVPIYGVWDFYLGQGIVGGKLTSGKAQGETAAAIARKIIQGEPADKIPIVTQSPNRWMFDYHQLRRFNIDESRLPPGSEIINRPQSIYGKYKAVIWSMLVTLVALALLSLFLMTNIQQRKKAEKELLASQQFIMGITGNVPGVVYQFYAMPDRHFGLRYVSEKAVTIFGLDPNPATFFDDFYRSIPPEARQAFMDSISAAVEHFTPWHYEGRFVRPDSDTTIWFSGDSVPHREGDTIVFDGVLMDITRAKATEEKLRRSERQMSQIVNFLPDPMYVIDQNGRVIVWNQAMEELSGITADAMLGKGDHVYAIPFYGERRPVMIDLVGHWNQAIADTYRDVKRQGDRLFSETMLPLRILGGRYFNNTAGPLYDENGAIVGAIEIIHDITERRAAENALQALHATTQKNLEFIKALLSAIPTPVFYKDVEGRYQGCNRAFSEMMGVTEDALRGKTVQELWPGDKADVYHQKDLELMRNPCRQEYEFRVVDKSGCERDVIFAKDVFRDDKGNLAGIVGAFTDVSAIKAAEVKLQLMEHVVQNSPVVLFRWRAETGWPVVFVSDKVSQFGYAPDDLLSGKIPFATMVHPDDLERVTKEVMIHSQQGDLDFTKEYRIRTQQGEVRWIDDRTVVERDARGQITHYQGIVLDITDRKKAEEALLAANRMLRLVLDTIPVRVFWKDTACLYLGCNQPFAEDAGFSDPEELIGRDDYAFAWCNQAPSYRRDDRAVMATGQPRLNFEEKQTTPGGKTLWLQTSKVPMRDGKDNIIGMLGCYQDVTERKRAHEELQRLRNYLSNIINSMPSVLIGVDTEMRVTQWNQQAEQYTGLSFEKARSQPLATAFPLLAGEMDRIRSAIRDHQVLRNPKIPRQELGNTRFEDITIFPLEANGMEGAVIRLDDVTEQVRMEEMMIQSEKMLSVGGLAAGMAHEINNPLAGILQNTAVLENRLFGDLPANHKAAEEVGISLTALRQYLELRNLPTMLENIRASGNRAAAIVRNMLSFARKSDRVVSSHDLGSLIDQTIELAQTDYDMKKHYDFKQIQIVREYDETVPPVLCESGKIQQVFLNILKNGAEAMAEQTDKGKSPMFVLRLKEDGTWVRVEIEDNGPGMEETTRRRIFEPFFTTKPVGMGTGLGLSVSYFIIAENHGGKMDVQVIDGGGTRFIIQLPKTGTL
jgi:PAS domain S-box-containing protein